MACRILKTIPALALALAAMAPVAMAQDTGAFRYVFTQSYANPPGTDGRAQKIRAGVPVQVQLPAGPAVWKFAAADSRNVALAGEGRYPSPGRIPGTDRIQTFDFNVTLGAERAEIVIRADYVPPILQPMIPDGRYVVQLELVAP